MKDPFAVSMMVVAVNMLFVLAMYVLEAIDKSLQKRGSLIEGTTQKFLRMEDWWALTVGSAVAAPLIAAPFWCAVGKGNVGEQQWWAFSLVVVTVMTAMGSRCLIDKDHKPTAGFPDKDSFSLYGLAHLLYSGVLAASAVMGIWDMIQGRIPGNVMFWSWPGWAIYLVAVVRDFAVGNFSRLKKEPATR